MALLVSWFVVFLLGTVVQIFREAERNPFPAESLRIGLYVVQNRKRISYYEFMPYPFLPVGSVQRE